MNPLLNLLVFAALIIVLVALFWYRRRALGRGRKLARRVVLEDALKHLYNHEERSETATLESLAGSLQISTTQAVALVERMQRHGLARFAEGRIVLSDEGRRYALEVIRAHRLWERYLADETGLDPLEWHDRAERKEHRLSREEAEALSERLGHPRFDPHGDPIPTADGAMFAGDAAPLTSLDRGERAVIAHVEDEPKVVYAQLVAEGLYPGIEIRVDTKNDERIELSVQGRRLLLSPMVAQNVSIRRLNDDERFVSASETLASLKEGESADVVRLSPACRGLERRRLMDLGIVPGTRVGLERRGLTGGLSAYQVRGTIIGLRQEQARMIGITNRAASPRARAESGAIRAGVLEEDFE